MTDIRPIRKRIGASIHLYPSDIAQVVLQEDVIASFTEEELQNLHFAVSTELQARGKDHVSAS